MLTQIQELQAQGLQARESEFAAVVELVNLAYRGTGPVASWNSEAGILDGQRLTKSQLIQELAAKPHALLLAYRDESEGEILGTVWLEPDVSGSWYLGLLTVTPARQDKGLGRALLAEAEAFAMEHGARRMRMTVVHCRETLIAWYLRRGYALTGETEPFPYQDQRFGKPLRQDLHFVVLQKEL